MESGCHFGQRTGQGVIGALAAVRLRLTGNDGRFKGHFKIKSENGIVTPLEIKRQTHVDVVQSMDGVILKDNEKIRLGKKVKAVLLEGRSTMLVSRIKPEGSGSPDWETCNKQQLQAY